MFQTSDREAEHGGEDTRAGARNEEKLPAVSFHWKIEFGGLVQKCCYYLILYNKIQ